MIVATAGHIDHGKTSLVKALTGIDTDRLPEEKRRGLTIDLGFAYPKDNSAIGFVDVPGHERFVRNMIAGVMAIDCALMVIAADDGPMPQTLEHLAILDLLGVERLGVALTKIDRVSPERLIQARGEIAGILEHGRFASAPVFALSVPTGEGLSALKSWLDDEAARVQSVARKQFFRMAVDRAFVIDGTGIVVTGAVGAGEVTIDDRLVIEPEGIEIRVRGVYAQSRKARSGHSGERCAINITAPKLSLDHIRRGQWLIAPELAHTTARIDARLHLLPSEARALRHWTPVHLHVGAADISARIALLESAPLEPGGSGLAQLVLSSPTTAVFGDRFIVRDQSGRRTIGGGCVIDPFSQACGRTAPQRVKLLKVLETGDTAGALSQALAIAPQGFALGAFFCARNLSMEDRKSLIQRDGLHVIGGGFDALGFSQANWEALRGHVAAIIADASSNGHENGVTGEAIMRAARPRITASVLGGVLNELVKAGDIVHAGTAYRPRGAIVNLNPRDAELWSRLQPLVDNLRPPSIAELAGAVKIDTRVIERLLQTVARMGQAVQIAPNRYYLPARLRELAGYAERVARETPDGLVSIRAFRDKSGVGRNLSVEALEFFDRVGFTGRAGEHRRIVKSCDDVRWARAAQ